MKFKEYMQEQRLITRNRLLIIAMYGAFAGAILMFMFMISGIFIV